LRRHGVATELLRLVERHAAAEGIEEIALDAWAANAGAIEFLKSVGFQPFNIALRKTIPRS
jgi:ribosomal protein S18 acetylase RimI-like enzyme